MDLGGRSSHSPGGRSNPGFGNFGHSKAVVELPGCLEAMIVDEILPHARRDTAGIFRESIWSEVAVQDQCDFTRKVP